MSHTFARRSRLVSALVACAVALAACGGGESGRTRNAVIERSVDCFATQQDKTDTVVAMSDRKAALEATGGDSTAFAAEFRRLGDRLSELWNKRTAHPDWQNQYSGSISDQSRAELQALSDDYNALLDDYNAFYYFQNGQTSFVEVVAYYDKKLLKASSTDVCQSANPVDVSTSDSSTSSVPATVPLTENDCAAPVVAGPVSVIASSTESALFDISECDGAGSEARVIATTGSSDDVRTSIPSKNVWGIKFPTPGEYQVSFRFLKTGVPVSPFGSITVQVRAASEEVPCKDKAPNIMLSADFDRVRFASTCDVAETILFYLANMSGSKLGSVLRQGEVEPGQSVDLNTLSNFGAGSYQVRATHRISTVLGVKSSVGQWSMEEFEIPAGNSTSSTNDESVTVTDVPIWAMESDTTSASTPSESTTTVAGGSQSSEPVALSPTAVAVPQSATAVTCDEKCKAALIEKSGIAEVEVKSLEVSVFENQWLPLQINSDIPLTGQVTNMSVRVTPKSGEAVVLSTSIHKGSVAQEPSSNNSDTSLSQVVFADSSNPEATFQLTDAESQSFLVANWWTIALVLLVLLLMLITVWFRKKSVVTVPDADTR